MGNTFEHKFDPEESEGHREVIEAPWVKRENAELLRAKHAENLAITPLRLA